LTHRMDSGFNDVSRQFREIDDGKRKNEEELTKTKMELAVVQRKQEAICMIM